MKMEEEKEEVSLFTDIAEEVSAKELERLVIKWEKIAGINSIELKNEVITHNIALSYVNTNLEETKVWDEEGPSFVIPHKRRKYLPR